MLVADLIRGKETEQQDSSSSMTAITERRISLKVSDAMYRQLTERKLDEGRSFNAIIVDAISAYLKHH